ncbi:MAG TPA: carbohydrate-binding family 9-like protein, partial [Prolixibacteraceae bacterium]
MKTMNLTQKEGTQKFKSTPGNLFLLFFLFAFPFISQCQETGLPKNYVCYRTKTPLSIDGKATESSWQNVNWTDDFGDIKDKQNSLPRFRTRAKMLWDNNYLYVFAELCEPHIWANLKQRDTVIFHDNDFEVFIDPDGDTHHYYEYEMNALNTQWDLLLTRPYRDGGLPINAWNFDDLRSAVNIAGTLNNPSDIDTLWSVEIAFPLKSFADSSVVLPLKPGTQWRMNFSRVEWQTTVENNRYVKIRNPQTGKPLPEDNWVWSPQGVINMHCPETWGFIQFSGLAAGT